MEWEVDSVLAEVEVAAKREVEEVVVKKEVEEVEVMMDKVVSDLTHEERTVVVLRKGGSSPERLLIGNVGGGNEVYVSFGQQGCLRSLS